MIKSMINIARDEEKLGKFSLETVRAGLEDGTYLETDWGWRKGMEDWELLVDVVAAIVQEQLQDEIHALKQRVAALNGDTEETGGLQGEDQEPAVAQNEDAGDSCPEEILELDRLVADCLEFRELSQQMGNFNLWTAFNIRETEKNHEQTLRWLLDPDSSHKLGDLILEKMVDSYLKGSTETWKWPQHLKPH